MNREHAFFEPDNNYVLDTEPTASPLAFYLDVEREKALRYGDAYWKTFQERAHYHADETYAKPPIVEYSHVVRRNLDGTLTLFYEEAGQLIEAKSSYRGRMHDKSLPLWFRKRNFQEFIGFSNLEKMLVENPEGTVFVESSPAPFDVPLDALEGTGFGRHSFIRTHQLVKNPDGTEQLVSHAYLNYLTLEAQADVMWPLTGESIQPDELLGTFLPLNCQQTNSRTIEDIKRLVDGLPDEYKVKPPPQDDLTRRSRLIQDYIRTLDGWLENVIYQKLIDPNVSEEDIANHFQGWEMAVKAFAEGKQDHSNFFKQLDFVAVGRMVDYQNTPIGYYLNQEYEPLGGSCGSGSGFGSRLIKFTGRVDFAQLTDFIKNETVGNKDANECSICGKSSADDHYHCENKTCLKEYKSERHLSSNERTKECGCGYKFGC